MLEFNFLSMVTSGSCSEIDFFISSSPLLDSFDNLVAYSAYTYIGISMKSAMKCSLQD